jgi:F0F1-type ATP synthase delta subunit
MLSDTDKSQIIAELEKHTGGADKGGTVKNLLGALAEHNRLGLLEGVCEKFGTLMSAAKGEVELVVTSASVRLFPNVAKTRPDEKRGVWGLTLTCCAAK